MSAGLPFRLINTYSPTKNTVDSLRAVGELVLGGAQVARGYRGQAALTGEQFVADRSVAGLRAYRTGDRVRVNDAGEFEFLG